MLNIQRMYPRIAKQLFIYEIANKKGLFSSELWQVLNVEEIPTIIMTEMT